MFREFSEFFGPLGLVRSYAVYRESFVDCPGPSCAIPCSSMFVSCITHSHLSTRTGWASDMIICRRREVALCWVVGHGFLLARFWSAHLVGSQLRVSCRWLCLATSRVRASIFYVRVPIFPASLGRCTSIYGVSLLSHLTLM